MRLLFVIIALTVGFLSFSSKPALAQADAPPKAAPVDQDSGAPAAPLFYIDPQTAWIEYSILGLVVVAGIGALVGKQIEKKKKAAAEAAKHPHAQGATHSNTAAHPAAKPSHAAPGASAGSHSPAAHAQAPPHGSSSAPGMHGGGASTDLPTAQADISAIPEGQRGASFLSGRPVPINRLKTISMMVGETACDVDVSDTEAEEIAGGKKPLVRAFTWKGVTYAWYQFPHYDPYRNYASCVKQNWENIGEGIVSCWIRPSQIDNGVGASHQAREFHPTPADGHGHGSGDLTSSHKAGPTDGMVYNPNISRDPASKKD